MTASLAELIQAVGTGLTNAARNPNIHSYEPNIGGQTEFHKSNAIGRLLYGSNRSGKTVAGTIESIRFATGKHPHQKVPEPPTFGRIITVDFEYGCDQIILPKLSQWIPPSQLINSSWEDSYSKRKHLLTLRNGSKIEIKAHGQDIESFAGTARHFLWCDEECPRDIFIESKARLIDFNGKYWLTLTSIAGTHTWVYSELMEKKAKNVEVFYISSKDNVHISQEGIKTLEEDLDEEEQTIRIEGKFVPRGGLVFKSFDEDRHVIRSGVPPKNWIVWCSVDAGFNNPTAWLWHGVSPDGRVVTFSEHYRSEWTARMHSEVVLERNKELDVEPFAYVGDPSMSQRSKQTGHSLLIEYAMHGVPIKPSKKHKDNSEIDKMNDYLMRNYWLMTEDCPNLIKELRKLPWKRYLTSKIADLSNKREEPLDKDNHCTDSVGYLYKFLPDLGEDTEALNIQEFSLTQTRPKDFPWRVDKDTMHSPLSLSQDIRDLDFGEIT